MAAENMPAAAEPRGAPTFLSWAALRSEERHFHVGLACAFALHALLIVGVIGFAAIPHDKRRLGEKDGALDGISVVLVDEADFKSRNTVPLDGGPPPAQPNSERQAAEPTPQPAQTTPEQQQRPEQQPKAEPQKQAAADLAKDTPDLLTMPNLTGKPAPQRPAERPETKPQRQPRQDEAKPRPSSSTPPSRPSENHAAFSRPPGITRSGENDDFARGVIRALRQTMPPGRGNLGRVTIRFLLSDTGNLVEVRVVATSADPALTQNVVFASKQSSFPFPPRGATIADRTFLVTYIYE